MAEFCKDCFMEIYEIDLKKEKIIVSKEPELCENCGEWKPTVIKIRDRSPVKRCLTAIKQQLKTY